MVNVVTDAVIVSKGVGGTCAGYFRRPGDFSPTVSIIP